MTIKAIKNLFSVEPSGTNLSITRGIPSGFEFCLSVPMYWRIPTERTQAKAKALRAEVKAWMKANHFREVGGFHGCDGKRYYITLDLPKYHLKAIEQWNKLRRDE